MAIRKVMFFFHCIFTLCVRAAIACFLCLPHYAWSEENVVAIPVMDSGDFRQEHNYELLFLALEASVDKYGPFQISRPSHSLGGQWLLGALVDGERLSVGVSVPKKQWEGKTIVVPYPVLKGIASYRLFFAKKANLHKFEAIQSLDDLRAFRFGQGQGWSTAKVLADHGFNVAYGASYNGMFRMLDADRYDLLMRGVYEVPIELEEFENTYPDMVLVPGIAMYTYLPLYFHVTKKQPILAERISYGLQKIHASGDADKLFDRYFHSTVKLIDAEHRKIFYLKNTNLATGVYERDKPYLYLDKNLKFSNN